MHARVATLELPSAHPGGELRPRVDTPQPPGVRPTPCPLPAQLSRASTPRVTGEDRAGHHGRNQRTVASSHPVWIGGGMGALHTSGGALTAAASLHLGRSVEAIDPAGRAPAWDGLWFTGHRPQRVYLHMTARKTRSAYWSRKDRATPWIPQVREDEGKRGRAALAVIGF